MSTYSDNWTFDVDFWRNLDIMSLAIFGRLMSTYSNNWTFDDEFWRYSTSNDDFWRYLDIWWHVAIFGCLVISDIWTFDIDIWRYLDIYCRPLDMSGRLSSTSGDIWRSILWFRWYSRVPTSSICTWLHIEFLRHMEVYSWISG